jgi:serine/threonine protein phosphatase PrpC
VVIALADGISSSEVSQEASESAIRGFLEDYYCTSDAWSVKRSAQRVLAAINSWLHAQTQRSPYRFDKDRGYVCTLSVLIVKSTTAHLFHVGDTRIYRLQGQALEQLTEDHRVLASAGQSCLSRALGINEQLEIDYQSLPVETGDLFILASDGVYDHADAAFIAHAIGQHAGDLDRAAREIVEEAYRRGSPDNLTLQIVRIDGLPTQAVHEVQQQRAALRLPPILEPRMDFDGYKIVRELHASSRSHVYLAVDRETDQRVVIKTPSIDLQADAAYLDRFLMEEWIARRIDSAHVLKPCPPTRKRQHLFVVMEFIEGQTLAQWMIDHPRPALDAVRGIVEQIARGLQAFHRMEMLHQDLRPENIMIDRTGTVKIIDFGSARVAGLVDITTPAAQTDILGTLQYTAPEYFLGEEGSTRSDLFSLGVIAYQMLTGRLPYGTRVASLATRAAQNKLVYASALHAQRAIPAWIDGVLAKAVHANPAKRQETLSEFVHDLRQPSAAYLNQSRPPLLARNPLRFWQGLALLLAVVVVVLLGVIRSIR